MASSEFPYNLATNTYILHDYLEIAYIVCTGAIPANTDRSNNAQDVNSRELVLSRLRNARHQFRQAAILVVLDIEKLELITFYKKADVVKDHQTVLAKFGHICKLNACKIERKNACRVLDLVKPELARVWKLFSEAVLSSLTLQTPSGIKVINVDTNVHLVPASGPATQNDLDRAPCETIYYLRRADLQIIAGGHLLLAIRESLWPPLNSLTDLLDVDPFFWKDQLDTTMYLLPTGQLARYTGGWIGKEHSPRNNAHDDATNRSGASRAQLSWFVKVREWLLSRDDRSQPLSEGVMWCTVEIPILEITEDDAAGRKDISWKPVIWPVDLTYIFQNDSDVIPRVSIDRPGSDPLTAAQAWYKHGFAETQAMATSREILQSHHDASFADGHLFDDDVQFGSPQQFMNVQAQAFQPSQTVYPTPPEAFHPQNTPGVFADGIVQTPISAQPTQASVYQSSPLATITDLEAPPTHESAISSFLQDNDDDDLFDDDDDDDEQKLVQPSFGDEPNWDFFDRETTTLDMKPEMNFEELSASPPTVKAMDSSHDDRLHVAEVGLNRNKDINEGSAKENTTMESVSTPTSAPTTIMSASVIGTGPQGGAIDTKMTYTAPVQDVAPSTGSKVRDFAVTTTDNQVSTPGPSDTKRRRSSVYDVDYRQHNGYDHKYGPNGKYHFELKRPSVGARDGSHARSTVRRPSSEASSSPSESAEDSEDETIAESPLKSWTRFEPVQTNVAGPPAEGEPENVQKDWEIEELIGVISLASGFEPFTTAPPPTQNHADGISLRGIPDRYSMVAQVLTEQLTQSSLFRGYDLLRLPKSVTLPGFDVFVDSSEAGTNVPNASLGDLAAIQPSNTNTRAATRTMALEADRVILRQADGEISAELPLVKYWETLNLQPLSGPKDVQALCIHPQGSNYAEGCDLFLRRMEETYTSCNMGQHRRLKLEELTNTGLLGWDPRTGKDDLSILCQDIGKALATVNAPICTIMYVILSDTGLTRAVEICSAFVELFESFGQVSHVPRGDVVLQIVPSSFLVHPTTLVVQPQEHYIDLAMEVYNRIPPIESLQAAATAGAVLLERPIGRPLHFDLNTKTVSPVLRSGHCCHIAYCTSLDRKWLVASWSDTIGNTALTMSYCLVDEDSKSHRPRLDILRHMCDTSIHLMSRQKGQSWLAIAKVGTYDSDELQEWLYLSQQLNDEYKFISRVVILNVELQSRLTLHAPQGSFKQHTLGSQPTVNVLNTPVTTPQATTMSPEQSMSTASIAASAQTPPDLSADPAVETETYLKDPQNETWMVTFAFGLNQTYNFLEIRPALASGFLLKRIQRQDNAGGVAMLNVNLIAVPRKGGTALAFAERERVLQDILMQYRGLHVLAVARKCVTDADSCIPWHVATAFRGAKVLESLM